MTDQAPMATAAPLGYSRPATMNPRPQLDAARKHLLERMRRVMDRVTVHGPPRESDHRRAEELARERGWEDAVRRLRKQR